MNLPNVKSFGDTSLDAKSDETRVLKKHRILRKKLAWRAADTPRAGIADEIRPFDENCAVEIEALYRGCF
jgi:hypothetical protein